MMTMRMIYDRERGTEQQIPLNTLMAINELAFNSTDYQPQPLSIRSTVQNQLCTNRKYKLAYREAIADMWLRKLHVDDNDRERRMEQQIPLKTLMAINEIAFNSTKYQFQPLAIRSTVQS